MTYAELGHVEKGLSMERDIYSGSLKLLGEDHYDTLRAGNNYTNSLVNLKRCEEAKTFLRRPMSVARRVLGENHDLTLTMRWIYARALYYDEGATLDDLRNAVTILEDTDQTARRILGGTHPMTTGIEDDLRLSLAQLSARETPPTSKSQN